MRINTINRQSFGSFYYEGYSKYKDRNEEFHFEIRDERPENWLTQKQNKATEIIENQINDTEVDYYHSDGTKSGIKTDLEIALDSKKTDIYFRYPEKDKVEVSLVKWGTGSWGDEYSYNPYNKKGDKRIKTSFSLKNMPTAENIRKKTKQFITDSIAFLTDKDNPKNKEIEDKLWEKC